MSKFLQYVHPKVLMSKLEQVKPETVWTGAGVVVGTYLLLRLLNWYMMGPTKGTDNKKRLDGKTVAVTGANTGIGKVTALELSRRGAKVLLLCRNVEKAEFAAKEIQDETGNEVVVIQLDLASLQSVRKCASTILNTHDKLDYLINNAGVMWCPEMRTEEGFEMTMGTNHFGHFLLTELLIPHLKKSAESGHNARIVLVSSSAHRDFFGWIDFHDINMTKPGSYGRVRAYAQSKLANIMHGAELARRLEGTGITVYSLHPGAIMTELSRHIEVTWMGKIFALFTPIFLILLKTPFYGSQTTLYCTLEDSLSNESGLYYSDCGRKQPSKAARNVEDQQRLWRLSEQMVELHAKKND